MNSPLASAVSRVRAALEARDAEAVRALEEQNKLAEIAWARARHLLGLLSDDLRACCDVNDKERPGRGAHLSVIVRTTDPDGVRTPCSFAVRTVPREEGSEFTVYLRFYDLAGKGEVRLAYEAASSQWLATHHVPEVKDQSLPETSHPLHYVVIATGAEDHRSSFSAEDRFQRELFLASIVALASGQAVH